jgi:hypothetical protein
VTLRPAVACVGLISQAEPWPVLSQRQPTPSWKSGLLSQTIPVPMQPTQIVRPVRAGIVKDRAPVPFTTPSSGSYTVFPSASPGLGKSPRRAVGMLAACVLAEAAQLVTRASKAALRQTDSDPRRPARDQVRNDVLLTLTERAQHFFGAARSGFHIADSRQPRGAGCTPSASGLNSTGGCRNHLALTRSASARAWPRGPYVQTRAAFTVLGVAAVAAVASYEHAYDLVRAHGESGWTARMVPLTVDGLIYASSMVMLNAARRSMPVPALARWLLGLGIAATLAANVAHGLGHGLVGASVAAWPAVALVGSYELLMMVIRSSQMPTSTYHGSRSDRKSWTTFSPPRESRPSPCSQPRTCC